MTQFLSSSKCLCRRIEQIEDDIKKFYEYQSRMKRDSRFNEVSEKQNSECGVDKDFHRIWGNSDYGLEKFFKQVNGIDEYRQNWNKALWHREPCENENSLVMDSESSFCDELSTNSEISNISEVEKPEETDIDGDQSMMAEDTCSPEWTIYPFLSEDQSFENRQFCIIDFVDWDDLQVEQRECYFRMLSERECDEVNEIAWQQNSGESGNFQKKADSENKKLCSRCKVRDISEKENPYEIHYEHEESPENFSEFCDLCKIETELIRTFYPDLENKRKEIYRESFRSSKQFGRKKEEENSSGNEITDRESNYHPGNNDNPMLEISPSESNEHLGYTENEIQEIINDNNSNSSNVVRRNSSARWESNYHSENNDNPMLEISPSESNEHLGYTGNEIQEIINDNNSNSSNVVRRNSSARWESNYHSENNAQSNVGN
ncbi:hypothetical protein HNY73_018568 [Argiope bruennichi]|uniref:Uncharacterized protein n=1 Tax=Argiope bruennichi TaxID=94029 RepID=A0A8T0EHD6_ARGBR|nr:hypothetical protein HNY73_018568 [Argiope bruennichi]